MIFKLPIEKISAPKKSGADQRVRKFAWFPVKVISRDENRHKETVWLQPYDQIQRLNRRGEWSVITNRHAEDSIPSDVKEEGSWPLRPLTIEEQYQRTLLNS